MAENVPKVMESSHIFKKPYKAQVEKTKKKLIPYSDHGKIDVKNYTDNQSKKKNLESN